MNRYDIVIIGGGIAGCAIARELARYDVRLALLEANSDVGAASTKGNGGMVHSGYDPAPGTLKAKLNVLGNRLYSRWAEELGFGFERQGSIVLGFDERDLAYLRRLAANAEANGLDGTRLVEGEAVLELEPAANPKGRYAFYCPHTGRVDPFEVAIACVENAVANGLDLYLNSPLQSIERQADGFVLNSPDKSFFCSRVINAAGLHADDVAAMAGADEYRIEARHGDIVVLDKNLSCKPRLTIYPIPSPETKGVAVAPTMSGNVLIGSTAHMYPKDDVSSRAEGIEELLSGALRLMPGLDTRKVIRPFAGERPVAAGCDNDFYIRPSAKVENFFHVAGIQSPGVASAPAIALYVADMLREYGVPLPEKRQYNPLRQAPADFSECGMEEKQRLILEDPAFGRIVCRCETVTEAEIVRAIHSNPPAVTLDAVKRRTRAGMGRCQSGFCQSRVLGILARELGLSPENIMLEGPHSPVVLGMVKGGEAPAGEGR